MTPQTLNYRALLVDPGNASQERPLQIFGTSRQEIDDWARKVLDKAVSDNAMVLIYQTSERQIGMTAKPKKESA